MKVNFEKHTYSSDRFTGAEVAPDFEKEYFALGADDIATLDYEKDGGGARLRFWMTNRSLWDYYKGIDMAEFNIPLSLDLRGKPISGDFLGVTEDIVLKDVIYGGVLFIKTPTGIHQFYLGEKSRGEEYSGELLNFSAAGQYQVSLVFAGWYRFNGGGKLGTPEYKYHIFSFKFELEGSGGNAIDSTALDADEIIRFDPRLRQPEVQKRSDDFYWWKDCEIERVVYNFINGLGQKFYTVTYSYRGNQRAESVREDYAPNFEISH